MSSRNGACVRQTDIPHSTRLFTDFLYAFDRVRGFYAHAPALASVPDAARAIDLTADRRQALVAALREQNVEGGEATQASLNALAKPGTVVVATGQQVGLFGGPVFAIYKALTAAKIAATLCERSIPAVAVFWLATEDHDLAEVSHAWLFDRRNHPVRVEVRGEAGPDQPVGGIRIVGHPREILHEALHAEPFGDEIAELASHAYSEGATFRSGFAALFRQVLGRYGLILLDPMQPAIRRLAAPMVRQAIEATPELVEDLMQRSQTLQETGYHAQVHVSRQSSLVFVIDDKRRVALRRSDNVYSGGGVSYGVEDVLRLADEQPERLSPNALLRPLVQDYILPTAVYVGGPAELAYLAQAEVLYQRLLGRMPVVVPRASFTLLDNHAVRVMERYGVTVPDCFPGPEALREKIASRLIPSDLEQSFSAGQTHIDQALRAVDQQLKTFDPTLSEALRKSGKKIFYQFDKMRSKAARESLRRNRRAEEESAYLSDLIYPNKSLQERIYCMLPFLARHGTEIIEDLYVAITNDCHDHQVLAL